MWYITLHSMYSMCWLRGKIINHRIWISSVQLLSHVQLVGSSVHMILQARILEWVAIPFSRDLPDPEIKTTISCIAGDSLPSEPASARRGH